MAIASHPDIFYPRPKNIKIPHTYTHLGKITSLGLTPTFNQIKKIKLPTYEKSNLKKYFCLIEFVIFL